MVTRKQEFTLEKPLEFRTKDRHYYFFTQSGIIRVCSLTTTNGKDLIPGRCREEFTRDELRKRPDLLNVLIKMLETWRA